MNPSRNDISTPANFLKTISIIHAALVIGQILFALMALVTTKKIMINIRDMHNPLIIIVPVLAITGFVMSNLLFKQKLRAVNSTGTLKEKLMAYQSALIVRFALLEGPSLFAIVCFLTTGEIFFLFIFVIIIGYFIYLKPKKDAILSALDLTYKEQEQYNDLNKPLY